MSTKYEYSISGDFPNQKVDPSRLTKEIRESEIVTALDYINTSGDACDVWFKAALSSGNKITLDGIVATHSGEPLPEEGHPIVQDGVQYVAQVPGKPGRTMTIVGRRFTASVGEAHSDDVAFSQARELQGAWAEVVSHTPGDYLEMFVTLADGTPVGQFAEMVYIPPSGHIEQVVSEGTVGFPAGFKVRTTYHSVASEGTAPEVYVWYRMRRDP